MENNKYVIINIEVLQKRIEELDVLIVNILQATKKEFDRLGNGLKFQEFKENISSTQTQLILERRLLKQILSQSIPLIPEIEKAFTAGNSFGIGSHKDFIQTHLNKEDYINELKLDI